MKEQEAFVTRYFEECFCPRKFAKNEESGEEGLSGWLDEDYRAYIPSPNYPANPEKGQPGVYNQLQGIQSPDGQLFKILMKITGAPEGFEGGESTVKTSTFYPLEDHEAKMAEQSEAWIRIMKEQGGPCSQDPAELAGDSVEEWLCKSEIVVVLRNGAGEEKETPHKKLWLFNKHTGKLCASWPAQ